MAQVIIEGLLLGLSSGAYCLGSCLAFFMPYLLSEAETKIRGNIKNILFFILGRFVSYIIFALIIGFLGQRFRNVFSIKFSHVSLIIISLLMLAYSFGKNFNESKLCRLILPRFVSLRMPFILGLFLGLNPCIPFFTAALRIWTIGNIFSGVVLFTAFFVGTSVYLVPITMVSYLNRVERVKQVGMILTMLSGLWFLFVGISGLIS